MPLTILNKRGNEPAHSPINRRDKSEEEDKDTSLFYSESHPELCLERKLL